MSHAQKWNPICPKLRRVQERARANREERFTSLAHHLTEEALLRAYKGLRAKAAAGPDGETKASYGRGVKRRIKELYERLKTGSHKPTPAKRIHLEKPDGSLRPIQLQNIEDCRVPCDYIPKRSYPLFRTRQILNDWLTQNLEEA